MVSPALHAKQINMDQSRPIHSHLHKCAREISRHLLLKFTRLHLEDMLLRNLLPFSSHAPPSSLHLTPTVSSPPPFPLHLLSSLLLSYFLSLFLFLYSFYYLSLIFHQLKFLCPSIEVFPPFLPVPPLLLSLLFSIITLFFFSLLFPSLLLIPVLSLSSFNPFPSVSPVFLSVLTSSPVLFSSQSRHLLLHQLGRRAPT